MASIRRSFVAGYLALVVLAFIDARVPRVFWTIVMPVLPLMIVLGGFAFWRRVCPIAALGSLALGRARRRLPVAIEPYVLTLSLSLLGALLGLRLLVVNGDGPALGMFLIAIVVAAMLVNRIGGGRSWCHYLCPVGVVERIYTDTGPLSAKDSSRCAPCSGCKRLCPDIDAERAYFHSLDDRDRRRAFFAFPGLILAFYGYYWLRAGSWDAFFSGAWTLAPASIASLFEPGYFFAPAVPAIVAAPLTLAVGAFTSLSLGLALEARGSARSAVLLRHRALSLASFLAFNLFYGFAGAPALIEVPGATALVAAVVPLVSVLALVRSALHTRREIARPIRQTVTVKSPKLGDREAWPATCHTPAGPGVPRRRVALPVLPHA